MTLRLAHEEALLAGEEIAVVRRALAACSQLPTRAQRDAGPASALLAEATRSAASGRSPNGLLYDINLAIDYLDFAPPARRRR
jgi:hypothetical protein